MSTLVESILRLSQKSTEELCVIKRKNYAKFKEKLTGGLKNDLHFDELLLSMGYKFSAKNVQKSYLS